VTRRYRIAVPDLVSNSYFPAAAAVELGCFAAEGLDVELDLIFPVDRCYRELKAGTIDFVGGSAHSALAAFPGYEGVKLLCAQGQGMYWFLVMRADLNAERGDLEVVRGKRIGAAPWVEMGLRALLEDAGFDLVRDNVSIAPVPGAKPVPGQVVNFGVTAARALADGLIDGFWANGMGTEVAVTEGAGTIVLDVRRGDGPPGAFHYTMASIAASDALIEREPETAAAAVRAIKRAQDALKADVALATKVGRKLFPEREANLIATLIERDLPYYEPAIGREAVTGMNHFARRIDILDDDPAYEQVVATQFSDLW
jgi:ABC-type nitrate/sulfonate/bicarbonate transport system substrate-binding protein